MALPPSTSPPSPLPTSPLQHIMVTAEDLKDPVQAAALLNNIHQNFTQMINTLLGVSGSVPIRAHMDLQGNRVMNVAAPVASSDAVSKSAADAAYSAPALRPQLEANGLFPLLSYRQLSNPFQREMNSSWLNLLASTAPSANTSTVTFGVPAGGFTPVTISAGIFTRADGSSTPYSQYNDSLAAPGNFTIATLSRSGGVVTGATTGANTLSAGETVIITGAGDASFNGTFLLTFVGLSGSPPAPVFMFNQGAPNASTTGGNVSLAGVYYYCLSSTTGKLFRIGPYTTDTPANRINAQKDGSMIVAVAVMNGSGGDTTNSAAGGTSPAANAGSPSRLIPV